MIHKEISIDIARSAPEVFALVDDISRAPEWLGLCVAVKQVSPPPRQVGTRLHYTYRRDGKTGEMEGVVTAFDPARRLGLKYTDKLFDVEMDFQFLPAPAGTTLKHTCEITPKTFAAKLMSPIISPMVEEQLHEDFARLKTLLEKGPKSGSGES